MERFQESAIHQKPGRVRSDENSEVAIRTFLSGDLYVVMGDKVKNGRTVRIYFNPLIPMIWLGSLIMFFGGLVSLSDRRYRVGAPKRARARTVET